jgi:hypothetical protein
LERGGSISTTQVLAGLHSTLIDDLLAILVAMGSPDHTGTILACNDSHLPHLALTMGRLTIQDCELRNGNRHFDYTM